MQAKAASSVKCDGSRMSVAARVPSVKPVPSRVAPFQGVSGSGRSRQILPPAFAAAQAEGTEWTYEKVKLTGDDYDYEALKVPKGYHWYETMMILKSTLSDEERDKELAKFEAFLNKEECMNINALVRGRSRMAYPIKGNWEGIYVLYTYAAKRQTARTIQLLLSKPESGSEDNLLRHISFCRL